MNAHQRRVCFSSERGDWGTPQDLFDQYDAAFHFELDVAASPSNAKCRRYYTETDDGLAQPWNGCAWCNPPYGRVIKRWVEKAHAEVLMGRCPLVAMLLPARTDTGWFHDYIWDTSQAMPRPGVEVRFLRGRLHFEGAAAGAPFPSMIVIFRRLES